MDRFLLVLCSVFLAIGMVSLVFPDGVAAIGVVVLVSTLALLVFRQFTSEREFLTNLFIAALLLRILFGVMIHVLDMRDYFGGDAITYDFKGYTLAEYWLGNLFPNDPAVIAASAKTGSGWGMNYLVAVLYIVFGHNIFAAQSFCAVVGAAIAPMTYYCSKKLFGNIRVAKIAAVAVAFFPAFIIWSGQLLKDGLIVFLLVLVMTLVLHLQEKFSWIPVIVLVLAMFGIMTIRFYIFYMVAIAVVGSFIIGVTNSIESIVRRTIALVVIGLGLTYFGVSRSATTDLGTFGNLEQLERSRSDLIRSANSGYKDDSDVSTSGGAISALPLGFIYLIFAPFPWQAGGSARQTFTIPEVLLWWAMLPVVVYGLWYAIKQRLRSAFPVLLFTLMLTLAYSIFLGNVGTAYRQRTQIQVFLFMFFGVGWTLFQEKRANARMLREASGRRLEHALRARHD